MAIDKLYSQQYCSPISSFYAIARAMALWHGYDYDIALSYTSTEPNQPNNYESLNPDRC